ncbi:DUF2625 family protein [Nocardia sp. NBC_01730]|uniref:DUF2625 family protein n=1 Tax=Nocardia sp. NBC_01730 TaxID=2975998 RepID=UPI003FA372E3
MRTLAELADVDDPAWPYIREEFADAPVVIEIPSVHSLDGARCLQALQVTTRSALGALAFNTGHRGQAPRPSRRPRPSSEPSAAPPLQACAGPPWPAPAVARRGWAPR